MLKNRIFLLSQSFVLLIAAGCASKPEYAKHPEPIDPIFLNVAIYPALQAATRQPPKDDTPAAWQDYGELIYWQKVRTPEQCAAARSEVKVSLSSFFATQPDLLSPNDATVLEEFFAKTRNDGSYFIKKLKNDYDRPRPYLYFGALEPCLPREKSKAYPSGHAALSQLTARLLGDFYPAQAAAFKARAQAIGTHRVLGGVHHRSDVEAGFRAGDALYAAFKQSSEFKKAQAEVKAALKHAK